jgi:beta-carotene hydroxylase
VKSLLLGALFIAALVVLISMGYGKVVLMLWFIPSRIIFLSLGFSFFWLPHVPHTVTQEENFTEATTIREGMEWLMGPALQNQNFHLIHHLFPMTPFYNNRKVWQLLETELRKKDLVIQHNFAIRPTIHRGTDSHA